MSVNRVTEERVNKTKQISSVQNHRRSSLGYGVIRFIVLYETDFYTTSFN